MNEGQLTSDHGAEPMKKLERVTAVLVILFGLAACHGHAAKTTSPGNRSTAVDGPVGEMAMLADEMCACAGPDCANRVIDRVNAVATRYKDTKLTDADMDRVTASSQKIERCLSRAAGQDDERLSPSNN